MRRGQHGTEPASRAQTARLLRPLRRREDKIARPARVRMRSRNPCTLWRRRLFGWYVRLLTTSLRWVRDESRRLSGQIARWRRAALMKTTGVLWLQPAPPAHVLSTTPAGARGRHGHAAPVDTG